jgi:hypothetical protein
VTSREEARASGAKFYDGNACQHCGGTKRYTSMGACIVCIKRKNAEKQEYLVQNPPMETWQPGSQYETLRYLTLTDAAKRFMPDVPLETVFAWKDEGKLSGPIVSVEEMEQFAAARANASATMASSAMTA